MFVHVLLNIQYLETKKILNIQYALSIEVKDNVFQLISGPCLTQDQTLYGLMG